MPLRFDHTDSKPFEKVILCIKLICTQESCEKEQDMLKLFDNLEVNRELPDVWSIDIC